MLAFTGLVAVIFILFWLGTEFFIESYYYGQKVTTMKKMVGQINTVVQLSEGPIAKLRDLEYLGYNFEGKITLYDDDRGIVISDDDILTFSKGSIVEYVQTGDDTAYIIQTDYPVKDTKWLVYGARIDTGDIAILQIPVAAIAQSIEAINTFLGIISGIVILVALLLAGIVSTNMTKPIKQLTEMADDLRQLKFDTTYEGKRKDELGRLGESFNDLSDRLDTTIKALQYEISKDKEMDTLRKQFIAQVSHELQTPLSVIKGYVEALEDGITDSEEERQEYYGIISDESEKMSSMIKELLALSALESGGGMGEKVPIELGNFFDSIVRDYETMLVHRDTGLRYMPVKKEAWFLADEMKLEQAFRNMVNNAVKYAEKDTDIDFSLRLEDRTLTAIIENKGPQIPEDELAKIFESFYKGSNSEKKEGTGIGLAVSAQVFRLHDITYFAKNVPGGVQMVVKMVVNDPAHLL